MKKIKEFLKKIATLVKKHPHLTAIIAFAIFFGAYAAYDYNSKMGKPIEQKDSNYTINKTDGLYSLKGDKLKNIERMVVVSPPNASTKVIVVKEKGNKKGVIYQNISREEYYLYHETFLQPYLKENTKIDFKYMNDYKGVGKALGLKKDPEHIAKPKSESSGGRGDSFVSLLYIGIMLLLFYWFAVRGNGMGAEAIKPEDITDDLDDLVGLEDIKEELLQLEDMYINKSLYEKYNAVKNFNVMMTGPAGVGKTKIVRCLAKRLKLPLIYGSAAGLQSGYVGGGARNLKRLVKKASQFKRAIIFLDEAESLFQNREGSLREWEKETINAFLALLDGVNTKHSGIIWMVASNMDEHKIDMDAAMLRRFPLKVNFRLPNFEERKKVIERLVGKLNKEALSDDIETNKLAAVASGMSPALLETMVNRASLIAIKEKGKVNQEILMKAFERVAVGLTDRATTDGLEERRLLVARHESGHFIMKIHEALMKSQGNFAKLKEQIDVIKISTESVSKMGALGFVLSKEKDAKLETLKDYEDQIMQLYGGMANEELYYGAAGVTAGAHNDIQKVSHLLKVMICEVGFYQNSKLNYSVITGSKDVHQSQLKIIEEKSNSLYQDTKNVLDEFKGLTDLLVDVLMAEYVLNIDEALMYVERFFNENAAMKTKYMTNAPIILTA